MLLTPSNTEETLAYCRAQHRRVNPPDKYGSTWEGDCQAFCHVARGLLDGGNATAYLQWLDLEPQNRVATSDTSKAPLGSMLFSKGSSRFGHIMIAARPFRDGTPAAWSTDLWRTGRVGKVPRSAVRTEWGHQILGYGFEINKHRLDMSRR